MCSNRTAVNNCFADVSCDFHPFVYFLVPINSLVCLTVCYSTSKNYDICTGMSATVLCGSV